MHPFSVRKRPILRALILVVLATLFVTQPLAAQERDSNIPQHPFVDKSDGNVIRGILNKAGSIRLIVGLKPNLSAFSGVSEAQHLQAIASTQASLLSSLGVRATNAHLYTNLPFVSVTVDAAGYQALKQSPLVSSIQINGINAAHLDQSTTQIGAPVAWGQEFDGSDTVIAILDTGVDKNHPFLTGKVVSEACYGTNDTYYDYFYGVIPVSTPCPGANGSGDAVGNNTGLPCASTDCAHGTHVAGIAAGDGTSFDGVARGAKIMAVQVFSLFHNEEVCLDFGSPSPCAFAFDEDVIAGLDRVYAVRNQLKIAAVNMSLGGGLYSSQAACNAANGATKYITDRLRAANIAVVASSGNSGRVSEMGSPACLTGVISVGSVNGADAVSSFSNAASFLTFLAPGESINSSIPGSGYQSWNGTSMAAPHVAGAYGILRQRSPQGTVKLLTKALRKTAQPVFDPGNNLTFPRIDVGEALEYFIKPTAVTLLTPEPKSEINSVSNTFTWMAAENTEYYVLNIRKPSGALVVNTGVSVSNCADGVCSYTLGTPLKHGKRYFWWVVAKNEYRKTGVPARRFNTNYPGPTTLQTPVNKQVFASPTDVTQFTWDAVPGAVDYKLVIVNKTSGQRILSEVVGDTTYLVDANLQAKLKNNRRFRWWVVARNELGSSRSAKFRFSTSFTD